MGAERLLEKVTIKANGAWQAKPDPDILQAVESLRDLANPENWAVQEIDGSATILWAGDPCLTPVAIAETGLGGPIKKIPQIWKCDGCKQEFDNSPGGDQPYAVQTKFVHGEFVRRDICRKCFEQ